MKKIIFILLVIQLLNFQVSAQNHRNTLKIGAGYSRLSGFEQDGHAIFAQYLRTIKNARWAWGVQMINFNSTASQIRQIFDLQPYLIVGDDILEYPFLSDEDREKLSKTGIIDLTSKINRQFYLLLDGNMSYRLIDKRKHLLIFGGGLHFGYATETTLADDLIGYLESDLSEEPVIVRMQATFQQRTLDWGFAFFLDYEYNITERFFTGVHITSHRFEASTLQSFLNMAACIGVRF